MRDLFKILGLLMILATGARAQVTVNDKGMYQNADGTLFTGVLENMDNGTKQSLIEVRDGLAHGSATYYYAGGKTLESGSFDNGLKHGKWLRYNESGIIVAMGVYNQGKKNGTWVVWNDNGTKTYEMHYTNGEKSGIWHNWDANGQLLSSKDFSNGN